MDVCYLTRRNQKSSEVYPQEVGGIVVSKILLSFFQMVYKELLYFFACPRRSAKKYQTGFNGWIVFKAVDVYFER